jgi:hypothetical protein
MKRYKETYSDLQYTTQKTKNRVKPVILNTWMNLGTVN